MKVGDRVYYIVSGRQVRSAMIKWIPGQVYLLEYRHGENSGAICLPASRVFESAEEAEKQIVAKREDFAQAHATTLYSTLEMRQAYDFCGKP